MRSTRFLLPTALAALLLTTAACNTVDAWRKRREARALEASIGQQREKLDAMSAAALQQAEAESREKAIAQYEKILDEYEDVGREEMDEALYLLGRLLFEREQAEFQRKQRTFESELAGAEASGRALPLEPRPHYPGARTVFERLLREFPDSAFREDALYDLGYILNEEGKVEQANARFRELLRENPRSRYAAEVHFRLGEHAFDSLDLAGAEDQYRAVLRQGDTELTPKALFKLGWVYYNLDRYREAKTVLADLLEREVRQVTREGRDTAPTPILFFPGPRRSAPRDFEFKGSDVYQETLEIIARVFAESGGADGLLAFIREQQKGSETPPYAGPLLHRLALVQKERALFDDSLRTYRRLLEAYPTYRDIPKIELELVQVMIEQNRLDEAAELRGRMLDKYMPGSAWVRANPEQEVRDAALDAAREGLAWAIQYYHAKGLEKQEENGGVPEELRKAIALYEKDLAVFPEGEETYRKRFQLAQALFAAEEYERAAEAFRTVAFDETSDEKREEAAFARILSVEQMLERRGSPKGVVPQTIAAYQDYIALNPDGPKTPALLFKEGQIYFEAEQYPAAISALVKLIDLRPEDPLSEEAHDLVAQAYFELGQYPDAEEWAARAIRLADRNDALRARKDKLENLYALAVFRQGERAEAEGQHGDATSTYLRLADGLPGSDTAPRALYNAAVAVEKAGKTGEAMDLYHRLLTEYVASDLAVDAAVKLAGLYEEEPGGGTSLVRLYERVSDFHLTSSHAEEFLYLAGKRAVKDGRDRESVRLFEKYLSRYGIGDGVGERGERGAVALYHLGVGHAEEGNAPLARLSLRAFLARPKPSSLRFGSQDEGYAYAAGKAHLLIGRMLDQEYREARIAPPLERTLPRKQRLLETVVSEMTLAVRSGLSPVATEASWRIGQAYEEFGDALRAAPKPPGLTADELSEYETLLEQQVRPWIEKAAATYRAAVDAARERSIDDEWVRRSAERLAALGEGPAPGPPILPPAPPPGQGAGKSPRAEFPADAILSFSPEGGEEHHG